MSFSDVYRKTLLNRGGSVLGADIVHSKNTTNRCFTNDYSYKKGQLQNLNMEVIDIDTRRVSKDKNTYDKDIYFRPDTLIDVGSYLIYDDGTYLVDGFNKDYINPKASATECEQELCFSFIENPIPCIAEGESYGVKLTGGTEFNAEVDIKVKITVPNNEVTRKIEPDHRFIFNHSKYGVYKVGDITVYKSGLLVLTCQKDKYRAEHDDLENNIAFNGVINSPTEPQDTYVIIGEEDVKKGREYIYTLEPKANDVEWSVSDNTVASMSVDDNKNCILSILKSDNYITLNGSINNEIVATKDIFTI